MKTFLSLSALLGSVLAASAAAAPVITAQSIIVNPLPSEIAVRVWTDRDPSGNGNPSYRPGESIQLYASVSQDAYLYLFNVDPQGQVDLILPNRYQGGGNFLKANTTKAFPGNNANFSYTIAPPYGLNKVLAVASRSPLNLDQIASFSAPQNTFATVNVQGEGQLAQALSIVVTPIQQNTWNSDTAYYTVVPGNAVRPAPQPFPASPAPVYPVQPVPVRPPAQAAPVRPAWPGSQPNWQQDFRTDDDIYNVYLRYESQLRAQGYVPTRLRQSGDEIRADFVRGADRANLRILKRGNNVEVQIERQDR